MTLLEKLERLNKQVRREVDKANEVLGKDRKRKSNISKT